MRLFQTILLLFFLQLVVSCSVKVYESRVTQVNPTGPWLKGRQLTTDTVKGLIALVNYEFANEDALIFNIGFINQSDKPILVDPSLFFSNGYGFEGRHRDTSTFAVTKLSYDPELKLTRLQDDIHRQHAEYQRANTGTAVFAFLDLVTTLSTNGAPESAEEANRRNARNNSFYANRQVDQINRQMNIRETHDVKQNLENALLRKTTLFPGSSLGGLVYFHRHNKASRFTITLPVESETFRFNYRHALIVKRY